MFKYIAVAFLDDTVAVSVNMSDLKSDNPKKLRTNEINCHIYAVEIYLIMLLQSLHF